MEQIHERVAGLDVHRDSVTACTRLPGVRRGVVVTRDRFGTTTRELERMGAWLDAAAVSLVAMEATGVYWRPVFYALEDRFTVWLCNAHHVKNVPGRKTDVSDAEWLADVAAHGMVRPSFVPPRPIRELRELTRFRKTQIDARAAEIQRLEKALQDAGIKLTSVASKVLTQSGRAVVEALISGERDGTRLAELAKGKLRPKIPELTEALNGHFGDHHHAIVTRRILDHIDFLGASLATLNDHVAERMQPFAGALELLSAVPGLDRISIEVIVAETGTDMSRFPTPGQLASWAGLCPGNRESAGRRRGAPTTHGNVWLRRTLIEAARAAARTKRSYFSAQYQQVMRRRGPNKAAVAVAHSLLDVIWHLLSTGETFHDLGNNYYEQRRDPDRERARLVTRLEHLGYSVALTAA